MKATELLERYDPNDTDNAVAGRLKQMSKGKKCIVFDSDGKIAVEESAKLVEDVQQGFPALETTLLYGVPTVVYAVGERPVQFFDENPIYPGRVLRSGQVCDQTNRSWDGVSLIVKQLLWIAVSKTGELRINSPSDAHDVMDKVVNDKSWDDKIIRTRFVKASLTYDEMVKTNQLPMLKVSLERGKNFKKDLPFGTNTTF